MIEKIELIADRVANLAVFLWRNEENWPVEYVSRAVNNLFGYSERDFLTGKINYAETIHPDDIKRVIKEVEIGSNSGNDNFQHLPYRIIRKDGQIRWVDDKTFIHRKEDGKITHYEGIVSDITEIIEIREELYLENEKFNSFFNNMPDALIISGTDYTISQVNPAFTSIFGYDKNEVTGKSVLELSLNPERFDAHLNNELSSKGFLLHEFKMRRKNGDIFYADINIADFSDSDGDQISYIQVIRDITEKKQFISDIDHLNRILKAIRNVNQLITKERNLEILIEKTCEYLIETGGYNHSWIMLFDENHNIDHFASSNITKENIEALIDTYKRNNIHCIMKALEGKKASIIQNPSEECSGCPLADIYETKSAINAPLINNGKLYGIVSVSSKLGWETEQEDLELFQEVADDIAFALFTIETEKKASKALENLRKSEAQKKALLDGSPDMILLTDLDMNIVWANKTALEMNPDSIGKKCYRAFANKDSICDGCPAVDAIETGKICTGINYQPAASGIGESYWEDIGVPIYDDDGNMTHLVEIARNITDRIHAENLLEKERDRAKKILDITPSIILTLDEKGKITSLNQKGREILGVQNEIFIGMDWFDNFVLQKEKESIRDIFDEVVKGNIEPFKTVDGQIIDKNGDIRIIRWHNSQVFDENGIVFTISSGEDITELLEMQRSLSKSEAKFRGFVEQSIDAIVLINQKGEIIEWNNAAEEIFAIKENDALGQKLWDLQTKLAMPEKRNEENRLKLKDMMIQAFSNPNVSFISAPSVNEIMLSDGQTKIVQSFIFPIELEEAKYFGSLTRDITSYKKTQDALKESEENYRLLAETAEEIIVTHDMDGIIQYANRAAGKAVSKTKEQLVGTNIADYLSRESYGNAREREKLREKDNRDKLLYQVKVINEFGETTILEASSTPIIVDDRIKSILLVARDITERIKSQQKLSASEEKYRTVVNNIMQGLLIIDKSGYIKFANQIASRLFGYTPVELENSNICNIFQDEIFIEFTKYLDLAISEKRAISSTFDLSVQGKQIWLEIEFQPLARQTDETDTALVIILDVTDKIKSEKAIRENEEKYRALFNQANDAIMLIDDNIIIDCNLPGTRIFGLRYEKIIGREFTSFSDNDNIGDKQELLDRLKKAQNGKTQNFSWIFKKGNSEKFFGEVNLSSIELGGRNHIHAIIRDISTKIQNLKDKKKLEMQLRQSQKMESIGHLAGGIAHDFNNLLTPILGFTELLLLDTNPNDHRRNEIEQIKKSAEKARALTWQLLAFGRKQILKVSNININEIIIDFQKILRRTIREDIDIELDLAKDIKPVKADTSQIEQILVNLAVNAQDAMPNGGTITISTSLVELDDSYTKSHSGVENGEYVVIEITDTGYGMKKETVDKIFEPFYTTKEGKGGTGLGLSTVYGIVKQHKGNIYVYSEPQHGTTFKVFFPTVSELKMEAPEKDVSNNKLEGKETILIVEDNQLVRDMTEKILKKYGYNPISAESPEKALAIVKSLKVPFELLLTDVIMPKTNGKQLYIKISKIIEDKFGKDRIPKVLYMSGYTDNVIAHHGVLDDDTNFIQKPFSINKILALLRGIFDKD
ncbi:MAG: PAS domain S-box protein [Candidatus Zixiibacteriota bacterium]